MTPVIQSKCPIFLKYLQVFLFNFSLIIERRNKYDKFHILNTNYVHITRVSLAVLRAFHARSVKKVGWPYQRDSSRLHRPFRSLLAAVAPGIFARTAKTDRTPVEGFLFATQPGLFTLHPQLFLPSAGLPSRSTMLQSPWSFALGSYENKPRFFRVACFSSAPGPPPPPSFALHTFASAKETLTPRLAPCSVLKFRVEDVLLTYSQSVDTATVVHGAWSW